MIFVPEDKEPDALASDRIFSSIGMDAYERLFAASTTGQIRGEASTSYTKKDEYPGVPGRALRVLGSDTKLIYVVRNPIERIISHHYHDFAYGIVSANIDKEVRRRTKYLKTSMYMYQLEEWRLHFSDAQILVVLFEDYVAQRRVVVERVSQFLGAPGGGLFIEEEHKYNEGTRRHAALGVWSRISKSSIYRDYLRELLSWKQRTRLREVLLSPGPKPPEPPVEDTVRWLASELAPDTLALGKYLHRDLRRIWSEYG